MASVLCCVIDLCSHGWVSLDADTSPLEAVAIALNTFILANGNNQLILITTTANSTKIIWPQDELTGLSGGTQSLCNIRRLIKDSFSSLTADIALKESLLAGALARSLCYINKIRRTDSNARICVLKSGLDCASQRMTLMNVLYTAQKQNITVDCLAIGTVTHSGLLQQACDMTNGVYLKVNSASVLLHAMLSIVCASNDVRKLLVLPAQGSIDLRPSCFCHQMPIDRGFVCSVCLSIYCQFTPLCRTCQTVYKTEHFKVPVVLTKKKKK